MEGETIDTREGAESEDHHRTARVLFVGIVTAALISAVVWPLVPTGVQGPPGAAAWGVWSLSGGGGLVVWFLFHQKAVEPVTEWSRSKRASEGFTAGRLQSRLVVAWAGAEAVALGGPFAYSFLGGNLAMLVSSLAVAVLCFARSAPREEWFRAAESDAGMAEAG